MFGHDSLPSKVYSFGATAPASDDGGLDVTREQMHLSHRYQNKLIEIERNRRQAVRDAVTAASPELSASDAEAERISAEIDAATAQIAAMNSDARSRKAASSDLRKLVKDLRARRKDVRDRAKSLRRQVYGDPAMQALMKQIDARANAEIRAARAASGVYFGTYLAAESAVKQARVAKGMPQFRRWDGDGKAGAQIQGGCSLAEALAGTDTRLRITMLDDRPKPRARVSVRVASKDKRPVWATSVVRWHRSIPDDARIKWAYVLRRRVGVTDHWSIQLTVSRDGGFSEPSDRATTGHVTIRRRWTQDRGGIVVAEWIGSDERSGRLMIPADRVESLRAADGLRSVHRSRLNDTVAVLRAWIKGEPIPESVSNDLRYISDRMIGEQKPSALRALENRRAACERIITEWPSSPVEIPEAFDDRARHAHAWKSSNRLAALSLWWRGNRFVGDEAIFEFVEQWRRHDKHLRNFECHRRRKFANWRKEFYRQFAVQMRRAYASHEVTKLDVKAAAKYPMPENPDPVLEIARYNQRVASPGYLAAVMREFGPKLTSGDVVARPA